LDGSPANKEGAVRRLMTRYGLTFLGVVLAVSTVVGEIHAQEVVTQSGAVIEALAKVDATTRELAEALVSQRETAMRRVFDPGYRAWLVEALSSRPTEALLELQAHGGEGSFLPNTIGDTSANLVYTPVAPCRVFDTRFSAGGILAANTQRNFLVTGSAGFPAQGGNIGGCGVPVGPATSVMINFAAVTPTGGGNLRAWAVASPQPAAPLAAVMNFSPSLVALANGIAVPICDPATTSCAAGELRLQADVSSVHVVGDVVGYFSKATLAGAGETTVAYSGIPSTTTTPAQFATFTITAPGAGRLFVAVDFPLWLDVDSTTTSSVAGYVQLGLCTTTASSVTCGGSYQPHSAYDPDNASGLNATDAVTLHRVIPVSAAGPVTLFVNANWISGPAGATLNADGTLHVTWMMLP
jgi:hypothetical protein